MPAPGNVPRVSVVVVVVGELHVPLDVCGAVVRRELDYWLMDETLIEPCCWMIYSQFIENQKTLTEFNLSIEQENDVIEKFKNAEKGWKRYMMHVWMVLDHPRYSKVAMVGALRPTHPPTHRRRHR